MTSSIVLGMTALFQMDMFEGGVIDAAPLHQGADLFLPLLEKWTAMEDYEPVDGLNLAEGLARFGSQDALSAIERRLKQVLGSNDIDLLDSDTAARVGHARRRYVKDSIFCRFHFSREWSPDVPTTGHPEPSL